MRANSGKNPASTASLLFGAKMKLVPGSFHAVEGMLDPWKRSEFSGGKLLDELNGIWELLAANQPAS